MRSIYRLLLLISLLSSSVAYGQISEDPEERRDQGQSPLKSQTPEGQPLPFKDRLRFGLGIPSLQIGNPFSIGISPIVGYQVSEHFVVGISVGYIYTRQKLPYYIPATINQLSGRAFGMYEFIPGILPNLYLHGELDQRSYTQKIDGQANSFTGSGTATLVGLTYAQPIGRLFSANISALYNLSYSNYSNTSQSLYGNSPLVIRIQFF
ncbi:hypothetical protein [Fibrella aquatilis]|uniref:Outer membrane protein beta-barrel domain-containing protein n=1 Tax=Fibrella aquatilis TaxID=2817059 RepID=A0A939G8W8_9BACT|nr:hypothetical protein [Fibrella aquatilis]MBO0932505.1 hypothetical protein [Fibrella aquatilis]